eukprot:13479-Heterococcus_DN1.PRE.2
MLTAALHSANTNTQCCCYRREAELHLALAGIYWRTDAAAAESEWNEGCGRLDATLTDAYERSDKASLAAQTSRSASSSTVAPGDIALCTKFRDPQW